MNKKFFAIFLLFFGLASVLSAQDVWVIKNARILTVTGGELTGSVLIREGRIEEQDPHTRPDRFTLPLGIGAQRRDN
jgi:hypothetical protein